MPVSVERFIQALTSTGIMTPAEADALAHSLPAEKRGADADELARDLVRQGKLTRFQAAAIYQDKADGLLLGNYLILDKLGVGGMGQVFRARHRRMDRVVALKVLSKKLLDSPDAVARFQREAKAAARLTHANIVTAHDADEAGGMHFLVMEFVDGSDLAGLVKQNGPLPVSQALDFVLQAARGLEHAHGEGVVHRDIKPSNLLVDKKGTLKILDMGLARMTDPLADPSAAPGADLTHSGSIMGTIDYMAPEQAMDSRQADARSDIYSLGCTLHYLLTARPPYGGDTVLKRLTAHQQAAIPLLSTTRPDIPSGVQDVFGRMVAKRQAARFQTSKELVAALDALRNQPASARPMPIMAQPLPVAAVPATPAPSGVKDLESIMLPGVEPGARKARQSSSKLPLIAAAVVLLSAVAGVGAWLISGQKPDEVAQGEPAAVAEPPAADPQQPAAQPQKEPAPSEPAPPVVAPPEAMPAKTEPTTSATPAPPPAAAIPAATDAAPTTPAPRPKPPAQAPVAAPMPPEQPAAATEQPTPTADAKLPVPSADAQRESTKVLMEVYENDFAQAKQPEAKAALAEKLLNESQQTKDDAASLYVMLHEARDLAVDAANPALAERAISMLAGRFAVEPLKDLAAALDEMAGKPHPADAHRAIVEAALARIDEAQALDDFETAKQLADAALAAARKAKDLGLSKRAVEAGKTVTAAKQQWDGWQKAQSTLAQTPDDLAANLAAGRYLCFVQGDWQQGLAHLAKGPDGSLKELAGKSLKPSEDASALADLGDAWFSAGEKSKGKDKADLRAGAAYWYSQAEPGLTGLVKAKIEKRLADLGGKAAVRVVRAETPMANGLWLPQTFDCSSQLYPITLGPEFNIQKSWTLSLEFRTPNLDPGAHQLFYWRDEGNKRDPLALRIHGTALHARLCDMHKDKNEAYALSHQLSPDVIGAWQQVAVHFDAATNEATLSLNGAILAKGRSTIVPSAEPPMKLTLGGVDETRQRFTGQLRNVWLGNQDKFSPPEAKSLVTSAGSPRAGGKLPETMELALAPGVSMRFRLIPAGTFTMGTPGNTAGEFAHTVNITRPFYLGVTEVTQAEWLGVTGNNPSESQDGLCPVQKVSWNDCQQFLERCNQTVAARKFRFRLPSEAEWEYACRAGTTTTYSFGDAAALLPEYGWFTGNAANTLHRVAQLKPNPWGFFDMHGGVWEWCSDWFDAGYYRQSPPDDPPGPATGTRRVLRGGSYWNQADAARSAERNLISPELGQQNYGLRVVCEPKVEARPAVAVSNNRMPTGSAKPLGKTAQAAQYLLSLGGTLVVKTDDQPALAVSSVDALPVKAFTITELRLSSLKNLSDGDLAALRDLTTLTVLYLNGTNVTDAGLANLQGLTNLTLLNLSGSNAVTDQGISFLAGLVNLKSIVLNSSKVTDAGLVQLNRLTKLERLSLVGTQVTGASLGRLSGMKDLKELLVGNSPFSDQGMANLPRFKSLSYLDLGLTQVSDAGVAQLKGMTSLSKIYLQKTPTSDAALAILQKLPNLTHVHCGSRATAAGAQALQQALPRCKVEW